MSFYFSTRKKYRDRKKITLLEKKNLSDVLKVCPSIFTQGKNKEIDEIIILFEKKDLLDILRTCPSILVKGKSKEIEKIIALLEKKNLFDMLKNCPSILAKGKSKEIENLIALLEKNNLSDVLKVCPTILAKGKRKEIEKIITLLEKKGIVDILRTCPYILAVGKNEEIEKIIKLLDTIDGCIENISGSYLLDYERIRSIVFLDRNDANFYQNCILYLKLKGLYNIIVTEKQLIEIANILSLGYEEFLNVFFAYANINLIKETLRSQGYVYFGDSCFPVREEELNKYSYTIFDVLDILSKKYYKIIGKTIDDAHDFFFDVFLSRCGHICINAGENISYLRGALINYLRKCIFLSNNTNYVNYDDVSNSSGLGVYDDYSMETDFMDKYSYLSTYDQFFLSRMSYYIETKGEYIKSMQEEFNLNINELKERLLVIRNAIEKHNMVKKKIRN